MAGKWFKSWPRYPSRDSKLLQLWWLFIYDLPVDIGPRRWAFGRRRSGGDLPASSLPQSPVANGAAHYGVGRAVATLAETCPPVRFNRTSTYTIQKKRKRNEMISLDLLILNSPICRKGENKSKRGERGRFLPPIFTLRLTRIAIGFDERSKEIQMGKFVFNRDGR